MDTTERLHFHFKAHRAHPQIRVRVTDEGRGIPEGKKKKKKKSQGDKGEWLAVGLIYPNRYIS